MIRARITLAFGLAALWSFLRSSSRTARRPVPFASPMAGPAPRARRESGTRSFPPAIWRKAGGSRRQCLRWRHLPEPGTWP